MRALGMSGWLVAALVGTAAAASPRAVDRTAVHALENAVVALPGPRPGPRLAPLADRMREMKVPAVSVAFIEDGRVQWSRAYGVAVAGTARTVTPRTPFQAGSMSKAVAAAAALRLVDQKRLSLDEDVNGRLRAWRLPAASARPPDGVTLRRLLSHTAGLTVSAYPGYAAGRAAPSLVQSLNGAAPAVTAPVRLFAVPGSRLAYSGGGYSVAQLLMTETAGMDFAPLVQRIVLRPAGIARSGFNPPPALRAAGGHDAEGVPVPGGGNLYPEMAAAGLWTTPSDYGRFLIALQDSWAGRPGALLRPASARAMITPVLGDYGLGVTVMERGGRRIITHGGANEGYECRFVAFLDGPRQGLVIMTNGDNGGFLAAAIQRTLFEAYRLPDALGPPPPRAPES